MRRNLGLGVLIVAAACGSSPRGGGGASATSQSSAPASGALSSTLWDATTAGDASANGDGGPAACPLAAPLPDASTRRAAALKVLSDAMAINEANFQALVQNPATAPSRTVRDFAYLALYLTAIRPSPSTSDLALAKQAVGTAFKYQCADAASCGNNYGRILFHTGDGTAYDFNSTTFVMQAVAPILAHSPALFTSAELAALRPNVDAALQAIDPPTPLSGVAGVSYTNIYLMRALTLVLTGEALLHTDPSFYQKYIDDGYGLLATWASNVKTQGINEFDSPTYYNVDLVSLNLGYVLAQKKAPFQEALDYFWSDIAANFLPSRGTLSGPHSRDYYFLSGDGALEYPLYLAGWRKDPPPDISKYDPPTSLVFDVFNFQNHGYEPGTAACALAFASPKWVTQRWGSGQGQTRTNYVGSSFAIGGTSADYGTGDQEKVVTLDLAGMSTTISLVAEDNQTGDNPYGAAIQEGLFTKPFRTMSWPVTAQSKGYLLVTAYGSALASNPATSLLETNLLLPADATLTQNGSAVTTNTTLAPNEVVAVGAKASAGAIRIFRSDDCSGTFTPPEIRFDPCTPPTTRTLATCARIVIYHHAADAGSASGCAPRVGLLLSGEDCTPGSCSSAAALASATVAEPAGSTWKVQAQIGDVTLVVERSDDFSGNTHSILSATADGTSLTTPPLAVNGQSIALAPR